MSLDCSDLRYGKNHRQRHNAEGLESNPGIGREVSPDDLVQGGEQNEKEAPSAGQNSPASVGQVKRIGENVFQKGFSKE